MSASTPPDPEAGRLTALFAAFGDRVFAYARRHVERDAAEEVVSETFLIAWRRLGDVPDDALPWLLVVARNLVANQRRKAARHHRMTQDVYALYRVLPTEPSVEASVLDRSELLRALDALSGLEREALLLTAWDGLNDVQAAQVCGCSPRAFRVRLHRARKRMERELEAGSDNHSTDPRLGSIDTLLEQV